MRLSNLKKKAISLLLLLSSCPASGLTLEEIAHSSSWKSLLHYFDQKESEVDLTAEGSDFFLSPNGATNPLEELKATLAEFKAPTRTMGILRQQPICAFPARRAWLESMGFHFNAVACPDFDRFLKSISPKSLTYVYSTAYPNNPASLFGHTLIRINQGAGDPLLDYGINYAALVPSGEIGIKYIPKGLLGLYPGQLEIAPYYKKVLEYNESENRDLWEYDLNFTEAETVFFVQHLWEVRWLARFHYTFLKQNCSYQMMRLFQVVRPESSISFGNFLYVLPGDTIRTFKDQYPNWFTGVHFRPSHYRILQGRYGTLNASQKKRYADNLFNEAKTIEENDPAVLETLISYYDYIKIEQQEEVKKPIADFLRITRVRRAKIGGLTQFPEVLPNERKTNQPDLAHPTRKADLVYSSVAGNSPSFGLRGRLGLHDLLDPDAGYEPNFGITALDFEVAYLSESKKIKIRQLNLVNISSLQPLKETNFPLSWRVRIGWDQWLEPFREEKNVFLATGGVGMTLEPVKDFILTGLFLAPAVYVQNSYQEQKWLSLSAEPFILLRAKSDLKFLLTYHLETPYSFSNTSQNIAGRAAWGINKKLELSGKITHVFSSYLYKTNGSFVETSLGLFF